MRTSQASKEQMACQGLLSTKSQSKRRKSVGHEARCVQSLRLPTNTRNECAVQPRYALGAPFSRHSRYQSSRIIIVQI